MTTNAPAQDHGRAGRNVPVSIASAIVLIALVLVTLLVWKTLFMVLVAAAVSVAVWELHRGFLAKQIDLPEQPLMAGGVVMVVVAYFWGAPALVTATAVTASSRCCGCCGAGCRATCRTRPRRSSRWSTCRSSAPSWR
jgi:phosphatidate cytidylyltransferase